MYSGRIDETVHRTVMDHLLKYYQNYVNLTNIQYETTINSGHTLPTLNWGAPCYDTQSPYIGKCNYDGAGISLQQIFGKLNPANRGTLSGTVIEFSQREFINSGLSMPEQGFVYVPASCAKNESCRLFVALHGCEQGFGDVGTDFVVHTGFNEWADTNNIIVLYPQAARSELVPFNPMGCWNWWGYNNNALGYDDKRGIQAQAIMAMMGRIAQNVSTADL
jgi:poly(3-hydroxybutyrate) depolymerase